MLIKPKMHLKSILEFFLGCSTTLNLLSWKSPSSGLTVKCTRCAPRVTLMRVEKPLPFWSCLFRPVSENGLSYSSEFIKKVGALYDTPPFWRIDCFLCFVHVLFMPSYGRWKMVVSKVYWGVHRCMNLWQGWRDWGFNNNGWMLWINEWNTRIFLFLTLGY